MSRDPVKRDWVLASIAGLVTAGIAFGGAYSIGRVSGFEAMALMEATLPTTRFLASSMLTASATILALMLTLLSFSNSAEFRLSRLHYRRVRVIALGVAVGFVLATLFLLLLNLPLGETKRVPADWYDTLYYGVLTTASLLGGILISVVLMLYLTVRDMTRAMVDVDYSDWLIHRDVGDEEDAEEDEDSGSVEVTGVATGSWTRER